MKFFFKALAAYSIGALIGALAAVVSIVYNVHPAIALVSAVVLTAVVDFWLVKL